MPTFLNLATKCSSPTIYLGFIKYLRKVFLSSRKGKRLYQINLKECEFLYDTIPNLNVLLLKDEMGTKQTRFSEINFWFFLAFKEIFHAIKVVFWKRSSYDKIINKYKIRK